ncbi:MAG: hypothetical protein H8E12_15390 [Rhodobacteraceae bacterium]|nr:hypothetical protein [Paracoccaceae bacterium]
MDIQKVFWTVTILFVTQIVVWYQLNGQLVWPWFKTHPVLLSLLGIPISYLFILATKFGYDAFGSLWPVRLLGFSLGMISFPIITWLMLGEGITVKTGISILLGAIIMLLQF